MKTVRQASLSCDEPLTIVVENEITFNSRTLYTVSTEDSEKPLIPSRYSWDWGYWAYWILLHMETWWTMQNSHRHNWIDEHSILTKYSLTSGGAGRQSTYSSFKGAIATQGELVKERALWKEDTSYYFTVATSKGILATREGGRTCNRIWWAHRDCHYQGKF